MWTHEDEGIQWVSSEGVTKGKGVKNIARSVW